MIFLGSPFFYIALLSGGIILLLRKKHKSVLFKVIAINVISIFLLISFFDSVAVKMFAKLDSFRALDNNYHHGLKPFTNENTAWDKEQNFKYLIKTNSLGFTDKTTRTVPLKKQGRRIMFIGDSFIEGVGFPWEETVTGIISEKFQKEGVEILNASVASYSPKLYWLKTKHFLDLGLEIDELYVFIDISDIIDEVVYDYFVPKEFSKFEKFMDPLIDFFSKNSFVFRNYRIKHVMNQKNPYNENSHIWGGIDKFYLLKPKWVFDEDAYKLYGEKGLALAKKHMDNIYKLCKKRRIKLHIVVWPWQVNLEKKHDRKNLEIWKEFAQKRNIDFIQMYDLFESIPEHHIQQYFIPKDIHWTSEGNRIVADHLFDHMKNLNRREKK